MEDLAAALDALSFEHAALAAAPPPAAAERACKSMRALVQSASEPGASAEQRRAGAEAEAALAEGSGAAALCAAVNVATSAIDAIDRHSDADTAECGESRTPLSISRPPPPPPPTPEPRRRPASLGPSAGERAPAAPPHRLERGALRPPPRGGWRRRGRVRASAPLQRLKGRPGGRAGGVQPAAQPRHARGQPRADRRRRRRLCVPLRPRRVCLAAAALSWPRPPPQLVLSRTQAPRPELRGACRRDPPPPRRGLRAECGARCACGGGHQRRRWLWWWWRWRRRRRRRGRQRRGGRRSGRDVWVYCAAGRVSPAPVLPRGAVPLPLPHHSSGAAPIRARGPPPTSNPSSHLELPRPRASAQVCGDYRSELGAMAPTAALQRGMTGQARAQAPWPRPAAASLTARPRRRPPGSAGDAAVRGLPPRLAPRAPPRGGVRCARRGAPCSRAFGLRWRVGRGRPRIAHGAGGRHGAAPSAGAGRAGGGRLAFQRGMRAAASVVA